MSLPVRYFSQRHRSLPGHLCAIATIAILITSFATDSIAQPIEYDSATSGTRYLEFGGGDSSFKILLEAANLGGDELELAEHSFAPGTSGRGHGHGSIEIIYVLSGALEHTVNGTTTLLTPGMIGIVRNGDEVIHTVPSETVPARVLLIWTPGGEIERIFSRATERPIE
jgi:quercetin dioxygenase-like cupin family protein